MEVVVTYLGIAVCAVIGFGLYVLREMEKERIDCGNDVSIWASAVAYVAWLLVFGFLFSGLYHLQLEVGSTGGVLPICGSGVLASSLYVVGWLAGYQKGNKGHE